MQTLKLSEINFSDKTEELNLPEDFEEQAFWRRQFRKNTTKSQKRFDWIFGVILPVFCFAFDPIVFETSGIGKSYLGDYKPFAYILSFVSVMAMSAFLTWGKKLKFVNGFLAGLFVTSSLVSFFIGLVILPISLIGLIVLIGALGFTPLFSSFVFFRNSIRAYLFAKTYFTKKVLIRSSILSLIFSFIIPLVINLEIQNLIKNMKAGDVQTIHRNTQYLKFVAPITNFDSLLEDWRGEETPDDKQKAISEAYEKLTGENFQIKLNLYFD